MILNRKLLVVLLAARQEPPLGSAQSWRLFTFAITRLLLNCCNVRAPAPIFPKYRAVSISQHDDTSIWYERAYCRSKIAPRPQLNELAVLTPIRMQDHYAFALAYEKSRKQTDIVYVEERTRQLRLHILLLKDDNDHLHEQLAQGDGRIDGLNTCCSELQGSLDATQGSLDTAQSDLRLRLREIETLKVLRRITESTQACD